jgi:hypothetical protein
MYGALRVGVHQFISGISHRVVKEREVAHKGAKGTKNHY